MKRSRDDGPGAGAAIKRCERDATRRRCDRASTRRRDARARRDDDARRGIRDEIGAEFSWRPTDDRGRRARREDDDDARGDECAMTDDARAIADGRQAGSGGRER